MIYLDNAATTWPKPQLVEEKLSEFLRENYGNLGRTSSLEANNLNNKINSTREKVAKLCQIANPKQIVFCPNGTFALNQALRGFLKKGDHVISTKLEHNAVRRPLWSLQKQGIEVTFVEPDAEGIIQKEDIEKSIKKNTKLLAVNHVSNVTGIIQPIGEFGKIAKENKLEFLVDAAQSAGILPIDVQAMNVSLLAAPGHKGLFGPVGTGFLYVREGLALTPLIEGGTGKLSEELEQPVAYPERLESGTLNTLGVIGLGAGLDFVLSIGLAKIREHELKLLNYFYERSVDLPYLKIYGSQKLEDKVGLVSFNLQDLECEKVGYLLSEIYKIAVRTGLHCAPSAHETIGTLQEGTVRISFSYFNTLQDIDHLIEALQDIGEEML